MDGLKADVSLVRKQTILDWIHAEVDRHEAIAATRLDAESIVPGVGPDGCNWVCHFSGWPKEFASDAIFLTIVGRIVRTAQARFHLQE